MAAMWLWSSLLSIMILLCPTPTDEVCDMKTTRKGRFCPADGALAKSDLVDEKTFYECKPCGLIDEEAGECADCSAALVKKTSPKQACSHCFGETKAAELCVKKHFVCKGCDETAPKAGRCEECEADLVEGESLAVIEFACDTCGHSASTAGKCADGDCEQKGQALVRRCTAAGTAPHGGSS